MVKAIRYHDISAGHRVAGHENKCRHLHGHNYRIWFHCTADNLDKLGRVIDFGVVKEKLCFWVEDHWDHRMLIWEDDPLLTMMPNWVPSNNESALRENTGILAVPFNPTAENMAKYLVEVVGPKQLQKTGVILKKVVIEETRKCSASYESE